jgi:bifunctional oligoribonuclease and PAP phosphatase NrnA
MTPSALLPSTYRAIHDALLEAHSVVLMAHVHPDGDTLGSMLAMACALEAYYPNLQVVQRIVSDEVPERYHFLPTVEQVLDSNCPKQRQRLLHHYDVAISLDCGALSRLEASRPYFESAKLSINMDHHISNAHYGHINLVEVDAGASGEVVARWLDATGHAFTPAIAINLYVTLLTDTGSFRFPSTTPALFRLAARLVEAGAEPNPLYRAMYENKPRAQVLLQADALLRSNYSVMHRLVWADITQDHLDAVGAIEPYIEGLIDQMREIDGVWLTALFKALQPNLTKVSLRSNVPDINVAALLEAYGGGGHSAAAGASFHRSLEDTKALLLPQLEHLIDDRCLRMGGA